MITPPVGYAAELARRSRTPIYQVQLAPPHVDIPTPIAYWSMNAASGSRVDSVGSNHLTDNNTVGSTTGKLGLCAHFDHVDQSTATERLSCAVGSGNVLQRGDKDWSGYCWVKLDSMPAGVIDASDTIRTVIGQWQGAVDFSWQIEFDQVSGFIFSVYKTTGGGNSSSVSTGFPIAVNASVWYFIRWSFNSTLNVIQIQLNNSPPSGLTTTNYAKVSTVDLTIGSAGPLAGFCHGWDGDIDEVAIFDELLSDAQWRQVYNAGSATPLEDYEKHAIYEMSTSWPVTNEDLGPRVLEPITLELTAEVERSRLPLSTLIFRLHDMDNVITAMFYTGGLVGWDVQFFGGFYDLNWHETLSSPINYVQFFGGIITAADFQNGSYLVTARSRMAAASDKLIFSGASTRTTAAINSTDTSVSVVDTTAFEPAAFDPQSMRKLIQIEDELMNYRSETATSFGNMIRPGATGFFVPPATGPSVSHASGSTVKEMIKLASLTTANANAAVDDSLHPIVALRAILRDGDKYGVGESEIKANDAQLAAAETALDPELQFRFIFGEGVNAKKFIEEEIYFPCAMYPTINNLGELGVKMFQAAGDAVAVDTVTDEDIVELPKWLRNAEHMVNMVVINFDHLPTSNDFTSQFVYRDETLLVSIGREIPLVIDAHGVRSEFAFGGNTWFETTADFLLDVAGRHIARFGTQAAVISVVTTFSKQLLEIGDDVEVTVTQAVNLEDGTRTLTDAPYEVTGVLHDFTAGTIELQLLGYPS